MFDLTARLSAEETETQFVVQPGNANVQGAALTKTGCNFCVTSPQAEQVFLCLFDDSDLEIARLPMPGKTGRQWHIHVEGVRAGQKYGLRVEGQYDPGQGQLFDQNKLLIDPYAKALSKPLRWDDSGYEGDSASMVPKSVVVDDSAFDWQGDKSPCVPEQDVVLYETHVKGFTQLHPDVPAELRGTYLGMAHPAVIEHLQQLGVTTVQLLPCAAFMTEPRLEHLELQNYWGYNPINFFAPEPRYAVEDAVTEFKTLVRELHKAGIEVISDVVFNHTAEGGAGGPVLSFKGLDNRNFYLFDQHEAGAEYRHYSNYSGCGNSVNVEHPHVLAMVADAMRYWVQELHIDGFRFDLAVSLAREKHEFNRQSAFFKLLQQDPVLQGVKLVAEPWDVGPGGYRLGQFPFNWLETNDKYRDSVRGFWRGDKGKLGEFATRMLGSRDVYHAGLRSIHATVNFIAYHDGFTLHDLVSYSKRHNEANGEDNMDGHSHNLSCGYGAEGPTSDTRIVRLREQQKRNMIATLMMSQGTPHFLAGDEMGRTQLGNNNAYCQDNPISWVHWKLDENDKHLLAFTRQMMRLRQAHTMLRELHLGGDSYFGAPRHEARWLHAEGREMRAFDWHQADSQCVGLLLGNIAPGETSELELLDTLGASSSKNVKSSKRKKSKSAVTPAGEQLLVLFNAAGHPQHFNLPLAGRGWHLVFDTARHEGMIRTEYAKLKLTDYRLEPNSLALLRYQG